jgi:membrane-bound lytic murein transglycosylase A
MAPASFADLPGWGEDDLLEAFRVFAAGARHLLAGRAVLRVAWPADAALLRVARLAVETGSVADQGAARAFFEREFQPFAITGEDAEPFFTGYFEPVVEASLTPARDFPTPVLTRPPCLVTLSGGDTIAGPDGPLTSALARDGRLEACPDRAAIEAGALAGQGLEALFLRDRVALFIAQVQGSAQARLPDGRVLRLRYDGRNGWPYSSIGRHLIAAGAIPANAMSLEALTGWLRAHPAEGEAVMRRNRSFVFFAVEEVASLDNGPIGGAGLALTAGRSIAVDRDVWAYGLPFFIDVGRPEPGGGPGRWRRLMVAQDTGAAIVGPGRVDIYVGSGAEAGSLAGRQRHHGRLFVLLPRGDTGGPR